MNTSDITFLHTAEVHVETFSDLVKKHQSTHASLAKVSMKHIVHSELLKDAMADGITPELEFKMNEICLSAANYSKLVVCTCSTLGQVAEKILLNNGTFVIRIDRTMADLAVTSGTNILVLAALQSTLLPTEALMRASQHTKNTHNNIDYCIVENSWDYFLQGQQSAYLQTIAAVIEHKQAKYDCIVLAQASMAGAVNLINKKSSLILSSPNVGVEALLYQLVALIPKELKR